MTQLRTLFFLLFLTVSFSQAQSLFRIDSLPAQGVLLDKGWTFHVGDNLDWAKPDFDDSKWESIDPTKDIFELPQIHKTGQIGWLRLRLAGDSALHQSLVLIIQQAGASELYLNGKRIHQIGIVSATADQIKAFNPQNSPVSFPVSTKGVQVLAIRYAFQPNIRYATHFNSTNPLFTTRLRPTDEAVSGYTNSYNREQNQKFVRVAVFAILSLLFFTLYVFSPVRKAYLYFSVYALLFAVSWYILKFVDSPTFVETSYGIKNAILILQTIGYLFMLNAVYATFQHKNGFLYWAMVLSGIVAIPVGALVYGWGWLIYGQLFSNFISIDITRVSAIAVREHRKGAWIVLAGCICYLVCWFIFSLQFSGVLASEGLLADLPFEISWLSISVAFAVFLAYDFGLTNRILEQKLKENETLSAEKQQILATQNETLERQVHERTAELNQSLENLKTTQVQLIQKEKLASLGELTAGIAHEIQNPLNFVNNFSEVSSELVAELQEERGKGTERDEALEAELLDDLTQNLQKITHHGGRASAIVKGMLEHARASTGERELTDLNALADQYLRLAYQGWRRSGVPDNRQEFTCILVTDFDPALGQADIVPQDIGRVLLNLYTNAFYAVSEKQKTTTNSYQPTVWVRTQGVDQQILITVKDNGKGIPDAVKAKIFQPFFTTKPTGEGTGLGLSLSYDIVTKGHGGTFTVESVEGVETTFIIRLPIAPNYA